MDSLKSFPERAGRPGADLFWRLQAAGWLTYAVVSFIGVWPFIGHESHLYSVPSVMAGKAVLAVGGFLLTSLVHVRWRRRITELEVTPRVVAAAIAFSTIAGHTTVVVSNLAKDIVAARPASELFSIQLIGGGLNGSIVVAAWCAAYFMLQHVRRAGERKAEALKSLAVANQARLEMLRYQLNPHFLFNALNSIQGLVREDPSRATCMIEELAGFLRQSLLASDAEDVPLEREFALEESYLAIEKVRFENNLIIETHCGQSALRFPVPIFLLHPMVENAVKYGMCTSPMPLTVKVNAQLSEESLEISVENSGRWVAADDICDLPAKPKGGVGLKNVEMRLRHAFPGRFRMESQENDGCVKTTIQIRLAEQEIR